MKILPLTYLGNTEYFAELCSGGDDVIIDTGENYVRQTYRNRCEIMTASGVAALTVNVANGRSMHKKAMKDMKIDNSKRWRHQHLISLISAYKNSPYFDHYRDRFLPIYEKDFTYLADLNRELLEAALSALKLYPRLRYSEEYVIPAAGDTDLRGLFSPIVRNHDLPEPHGSVAGSSAEYAAAAENIIAAKNTSPAAVIADAAENIVTAVATGNSSRPYFQVFSDRIPFAPNLSIIDLLFCEGPDATDILIPVTL